MAVQLTSFQPTLTGLQEFPSSGTPQHASRALLTRQVRDQVSFGCGISCKSDDDKDKDKTNFKPQTVKLWDKDLSFFQNIALFPIWLYQKLTRGREKHTALGKIVSARCPYNPSCSEYTAEAIQKKGAIKGWLMGLYRVGVKCNPLYFLYRHWRYGEPILHDPRSINDPVK